MSDELLSVKLPEWKIMKFWSSVDIKSSEECWNWQKSKMRSGYGMIRLNLNGKDKCYGSHRIAYVLCGGKIKKGQVVIHKCDNPSCCNPSHLWVGGQDENMQDKRKKGRVRLGILSDQLRIFNIRAIVSLN